MFPFTKDKNQAADNNNGGQPGRSNNLAPDPNPLQYTGVFAVRDRKAGLFLAPVFIQTKGQALRSFEKEASNPESQFHQFPFDFEMCYLGRFEMTTGQWELLDFPESLAVASEFVRPASTPEVNNGNA